MVSKPKKEILTTFARVRFRKNCSFVPFLTVYFVEPIDRITDFARQHSYLSGMVGFLASETFTSRNLLALMDDSGWFCSKITTSCVPVGTGLSLVLGRVPYSCYTCIRGSSSLLIEILYFDLLYYYCSLVFETPSVIHHRRNTCRVGWSIIVMIYI